MTRDTLDQKLEAINKRFYIQMLITFMIALPVSAAISYYMATIGHPTAYWLWHNILGAM